MTVTYLDSDDDTVSLQSENEIRMISMKLQGKEIRVGDLIKVFGQFKEIHEIDAKPSTFLLWLEDQRLYIIKRYEMRDIIRVYQ